MRGHAGASGREMWSRAGNRGAVVPFVAEGLIPHTGSSLLCHPLRGFWCESGREEKKSSEVSDPVAAVAVQASLSSPFLEGPHTPHTFPRCWALYQESLQSSDWDGQVLSVGGEKRLSQNRLICANGKEKRIDLY